MREDKLRTNLTNGKFNYTLRLFIYGGAFRVQYTKTTCDIGLSRLVAHEDGCYETQGMAIQHYFRIFNYMVAQYKIECD